MNHINSYRNIMSNIRLVMMRIVLESASSRTPHTVDCPRLGPPSGRSAPGPGSWRVGRFAAGPLGGPDVNSESHAHLRGLVALKPDGD